MSAPTGGNGYHSHPRRLGLLSPAPFRLGADPARRSRRGLSCLGLSTLFIALPALAAVPAMAAELNLTEIDLAELEIVLEDTAVLAN